MCLINGTSIERLPVECITYWHVELDEHDILVTEGLPVESYIDLGSRAWFEAESDNLLENPDFVPTGRNGRCRPVVTEGPLVEAERARLSAWFADTLTAQCAWDEAKRCSWLAV
ncbi:Hint domain-containing protein [Methylobacterium sp. 174MFSha1.1]|nr:Hint domain-containing protein [Methylobacterium sp. 174MFSha1.1]